MTSSAYSLTTYTHPIADNLPMKTLVVRQLQIILCIICFVDVEKKVCDVEKEICDVEKKICQVEIEIGHTTDRWV